MGGLLQAPGPVSSYLTAKTTVKIIQKIIPRIDRTQLFFCVPVVYGQKPGAGPVLAQLFASKSQVELQQRRTHGHVTHRF